MNIHSFREMRIWQEAHALTLLIYHVSGAFPADERYSLTAQLRRSASSVAANIVEGMGRRGPKELARFLFIARGSAKEALYHCILAKDLGFIEMTLADEIIGRYEGLNAGIYALIEKIKKRVP